jgi:hypothetical protein
MENCMCKLNGLLASFIKMKLQMNGKSHMQIEWPFCNVHHNEIVDITNGSVEVLETPCGNKV